LLQERRGALRRFAHARVEVESGQQRFDHAPASAPRRAARAASARSKTRTNGSQIAPARNTFSATSTQARQSSVARNTLTGVGIEAGVYNSGRFTQPSASA